MNALHHDYIMPNISIFVSLLEFLCILHSGSQRIELHLIAKVCYSHHEFSFQNTSLEDTGIYTCETTVRSTTTSVDFLVERLEFSLITYGKKQLSFSFYQVLLMYHCSRTITRCVRTEQWSDALQYSTPRFSSHVYLFICIPQNNAFTVLVIWYIIMMSYPMLSAVDQK